MSQYGHISLPKAKFRLGVSKGAGVQEPVAFEMQKLMDCRKRNEIGCQSLSCLKESSVECVRVLTRRIEDATMMLKHFARCKDGTPFDKHGAVALTLEFQPTIDQLQLKLYPIITVDRANWILGRVDPTKAQILCPQWERKHKVRIRWRAN